MEKLWDQEEINELAQLIHYIVGGLVVRFFFLPFLPLPLFWYIFHPCLLFSQLKKSHQLHCVASVSLFANRFYLRPLVLSHDTSSYV